MIRIALLLLLSGAVCNAPTTVEKKAQGPNACSTGYREVKAKHYTRAIDPLERCKNGLSLLSKPGMTAYYLLIIAYYYSEQYTRAHDMADFIVPAGKPYLEPPMYDFLLQVVLPSLDPRYRGTLSIDTLANPLLEERKNSPGDCDKNPQCTAFQNASPEEKWAALKDFYQGPNWVLKSGAKVEATPPIPERFPATPPRKPQRHP